MPSPSEHSRRSAAVTGAGSGLGRDIALGLAAKGYVVFGTAMSAAEVQDMKDASGGRVSLTVCDMTREQAVKAWADGVSDALGASGLDLLINNAGILTPGPIEVLPLDAIRREFDVNVFGALSVMNAFLPALRKARGRSSRSVPGRRAFRSPSTDHQARRRRPWRHLQPFTAPS
ncbi:SDR family NAD(P)-dependent oxidoreductase [Bradyrhizobium sp. LA2.1]|uniref:SDR family oxidoreductase n=1 Tax=Bradyrhizobium sp. LA2.1 TaxID=3156376 RepID=UPI0033987393